jgi:hypothetical protein
MDMVRAGTCVLNITARRVDKIVTIENASASGWPGKLSIQTAFEAHSKVKIGEGHNAFSVSASEFSSTINQ